MILTHEGTSHVLSLQDKLGDLTSNLLSRLGMRDANFRSRPAHLRNNGRICQPIGDLARNFLGVTTKVAEASVDDVRDIALLLTWEVS